MRNRLKLFCKKMKKTHSSILFRIEAKYSTIYLRITHLKFLWCIKMAWNCSKIENIHWLNAFVYEMYCQFIFTVKMHQSIYKASTHRIMQFSLKIDIIVWSLSLSSIFLSTVKRTKVHNVSRDLFIIVSYRKIYGLSEPTYISCFTHYNPASYVC